MKHSADPTDPHDIADWMSRPPSSYPFAIDRSTHRPLNPFGRTGLMGRGKCYYWGCNHAADCILTRGVMERAGREEERELLAIKRKDTGEWAIIGGMIDRGELPEECIQREFGEEVLGMEEQQKVEEEDETGHKKKNNDITTTTTTTITKDNNNTPHHQTILHSIFSPSNRRVVYRGYVDDSRNTDNSWIETCAFQYDWPESLKHLTKEEIEKVFVGGSDAVEVKWIPIREGNTEFDHLYASHKSMVLLAMKQRRTRGMSLKS